MPSVDVSNGQIADLRAVEQLTSLTDISRLLHETLAKERGLEAELDQLLSRRGELEQTLLSLHTGSREVQVLLTVQPVSNTCRCLDSAADTRSGQGRSRKPCRQRQADF